MQNINENELTTIRIALLDKIESIKEWLQLAEQQKDLTLINYWKCSLDKHTTLLNKLY